MKIKISFIIPVYNVEHYIRACLDSIFLQEEDEQWYEVIVVNDGSPDKSMEIVREYTIHCNLMIIEQKNQGLSVARNMGLAMARGEYVWFVDSDDTLLHNAFNIIRTAIEQHPEIDVFATVLQQHYERTGKKVKEYEPNLEVKNGRDYMFRNRNANCGACQRYIFKREFLQRNNLQFLPGVYHEDAEFSYRMLYLADNLEIIETPIYSYLLRNSGSIMSMRKMKMNYDLVKIYNILEKFADEKVDKQEYWLYRATIYRCLRCTIGFSRKEIYSREFAIFYKINKKLIKGKALELCLHPIKIGSVNFTMALQYAIAPKLEIQLKTLLNRWLMKKY